MRVSTGSARWYRRFRDEDGATAVILLLLLVVLIGVTALTIDGGLLWVKKRNVQSAADAAALSWARSCATAAGGTAQTDALAVAQQNSTNVTLRSGYPQYGSGGCALNGGTVKVSYQGNQNLLFGPAVGVSSPKVVVASARARWGGAGGADKVVPLMISFRNTDCNIPNGTPPQTCHFWWDDDFAGMSTFGIMNLSTWGSTTCTPGAVDSNLNSAIDDGWPTPLLLTTNPTYVCGVNNSSVHGNVFSHIDHILPHTFMFPVNDPAQQVPPCPNTATTCQPPVRYAVIGFAEMTMTVASTNNRQAQAMCNGVASPGSGGNYRCIQATWTGWNTTGYVPGGGTSFGVVAIGLDQ